MRILFVVGRELSYERNEVLLRAFRRFADVTVIGNRQKSSLLGNSVYVGAKAWQHLQTNPRYDLIFVGFYGHIIVQLLRPVLKSCLLFDAFVSNYDTLCFDRRQVAPNSLAGQLAFWLDRSSCRAADTVLLDTAPHRDYFTQTFDLPPSHIQVVPVGCNEDLFQIQPQPAAGSVTNVLYYCTYLPLHGAEVVVQAAHLLHRYPIRFRMIGDGPQFQQVRQLAEDLNLDTVDFIAPVSRVQLAQEIAASDVCLGGHFGTSGKSQRVVPGKIYQMLASGRPVIAADSIANRELLTASLHALLVPSAAPRELADAIYVLHSQPQLRTHLGQAGFQRYRTQASEAVITTTLRTISADLQMGERIRVARNHRL